MQIDELNKKIKEEYEKQGYTLGGGLLYSPKETLLKSHTVFLGVNPGGREPSPTITFSCEEGSAYTTQEWEAGTGVGNAPLQIQVQTLFKILNVDANQVLSGNLIPFKTPSEKGLGRDAVEFGKKIWGKILTQKNYRIVLMGRLCETAITNALNAQFVDKCPTGWGQTEARFYKYSSGEICALPHLSRYRIFNRNKTTELERKLQKMPVYE